LAVLEHAVSAIVVVKRAKEQVYVYYVSQALVEAEFNYPLIEKFTYALVMASRKLGPYFEAHKIVVLTGQPLENILQRLDASRRLLKWAVELSRYDLIFEPRQTIKAHALGGFLAENLTPSQTMHRTPDPGACTLTVPLPKMGVGPTSSLKALTGDDISML